MNLQPWPNTHGGPPSLIGSWASGRWVERAAHEFDGWIGSGRTSFRLIAEGIRRYRAAGGKRAILGTVSVDLRVPTEPLSDEEHFHLRCAPAEAATRLKRIADLGYDEVLLTNLNHTEADFPESHLDSIRALHH